MWATGADGRVNAPVDPSVAMPLYIYFSHLRSKGKPNFWVILVRVFLQWLWSLYVCIQLHNVYVVIYCADDSEELRPCQQLNRKSVASAFWKYQIEDELNDDNRRDYIFNGSQAQEKFMQEVDVKRANSVYEHKSCSRECKRRGKEFMW